MFYTAILATSLGLLPSAVGNAQDLRYSSKASLQGPTETIVGQTERVSELSMAATSSKPWLYPTKEFNIALAPETPDLRAAPAISEATLGGSKVAPEVSSSSKPWLSHSGQ